MWSGKSHHRLRRGSTNRSCSRIAISLSLRNRPRPHGSRSTDPCRPSWILLGQGKVHVAVWRGFSISFRSHISTKALRNSTAHTQATATAKESISLEMGSPWRLPRAAAAVSQEEQQVQQRIVTSNHRGLTTEAAASLPPSLIRDLKLSNFKTDDGRRTCDHGEDLKLLPTILHFSRRQ